MSRMMLNLIVVLLLVLPVAAVAADKVDTAPAQSPDRPAVWGEWPAVPWDDVAVEPRDSVLNQPIDLSRKGKPGNQRRYQIKRINLTVDRQGMPINRMVAEGQLLRTLVSEAEPGLWTEKCEWERFAAGQGMAPSDYPTPHELPGARGISFEFSPRTFDYINPPADFARVGDELSGYLLKVLTMDAMGWDAILLTLREEHGSKLRIGDTWREAKWAPWDITRVGAEGVVGQYQAGEMQVSVAGLTRLHGEPCVLIWFSMEGNKVNQQFDNPMLAMNMQATEYFRGEVAASLVDGRLVGMELWGPLPCVMQMGFGGQPPTEQPIGAIIQEVSMWEIPTGLQKESPGP